MLTVEYREIEQILGRSRALTDVSEAHGTLAGALCAATGYSLEDWLREIYADGSTEPDVQQRLQEVFDSTRGALSSQGMEFAALLPDDAAPIAERASALGQWCQGFLYGLGTSSLPDPESVSPEIAEIVRDLTAITQVGVDASTGDEANEEAYAELVEFVRVGAQLLFDELARFRHAQRQRPASSEGALH